MRVGFVGAGGIAAAHVERLSRIGGVEVAGVCDLDEERARSLVPGAAAYTGWEELYERERLDAVFVCTPPLHHRGPAVEALRRRLHLYLEKPVARDLDDARAILAAAEAGSTVCAIGYQWRGIEVLPEIAAALDGQDVGFLLGVSIGGADARPWFLDRAQGGGNLLERASHHVDLARAIAGEVVEVQAAASRVPLAQADERLGDIEDEVSLSLRFAAGGLGAIHVAWVRSGQLRRYSVDVLAADASLRLTLDPEFGIEGTSRGRPVNAKSSSHPSDRTIERFVEAAAAGDRGAVFSTPREATLSLAVALACEQALAGGGTVAVPAL
jgi:predicted dehydrogenase